MKSSLTEKEILEAKKIILKAMHDWKAAPYAWHWSELVLMALDREGFIKRPVHK